MVKRIPAFFLFLQFGLSGQTLHLSSASAAAGESITIEISLKSPNGIEASALQWEITIPAAQLSFLDKDTTAGPAAQAAAKSVSCALKPPAVPDSTAVCILYGGRESIRNGVVARLGFKTAPDATLGSVRIRLSHALAVSKDLKRMPINDAETTVSIRSDIGGGAR